MAIIATLDAPPALADEPLEVIRAAVTLPCQTRADLQTLARQLPAVELERVRSARIGIVGRRLVFGIARDELIVEFAGPTGRPDRVAARYTVGSARRPLLLALADHRCAIHTARLLSYDASGRPAALIDLDDALRPIGEPEPINPPVPDGVAPQGIPVALIDSGVNYLLPDISGRLARDDAGQIWGYDYWDLDRRPFDIEPTPDPFFPGRHGTRTASILLEEAPVAKLVPYRYPHDDMTRMTAVIEDAARHGIRVLNLSLATRVRNEWLPFAAAARDHPEMLFVVAAGNMGRDLADQPAYPAALDLANMIVVTSASADGRLSEAANFGAQAVDLMVATEWLTALDFDGVRRQVSGSSYATARVSALAACLLAARPDWSTADLKAAIFDEADPAEHVAQGLIPDDTLGNRGACQRTLACRGPSPAC